MAFFDFFKKKPEQKAVKDDTSAIQSALAAFAADEGKGWQNLVAAIEAKVGDKMLAVDLYRFLPIAYARLLLPDAQLADHYRQQTKQGDFTEHKLADNPLYVQIFTYLMLNPPQKGQYENLIGYNAELNAINQALNAGSRLEDLIMAPPTFL
jgi:hypothetical protein